MSQSAKVTGQENSAPVWCGWCHTRAEPHAHAVDGYRGLVTSQVKREVIRIMLDNVFPTTWGRQAYFDTYQYLSNHLFFRVPS